MAGWKWKLADVLDGTKSLWVQGQLTLEFFLQ
jgi:hypothetical protein